ncbi:MAG: DUF86 domain-containing protein [Acidobacteria bacterium]|nr:DUF86 domain-containing protein [Acidobacteriota bacterium]
MRSDADRFADMLGAAGKISSATNVGIEVFLADEMLQVWVIHHLQLIGEAARAVSAPLRERYPEVPWGQIIALRNILVHEYFGLNLRQVFETTKQDLPDLERQLRRIKAELSD